MKSFLLVALTIFASTSVFASKARLTALGSSFHLNDSQFIFNNPSQLAGLGNYLNYETGITTPAAASTSKNMAEGTVSYGLADGNRVAVALGKRDDIVQLGRNLINSVVGAGHYGMSENPLHVFFLNQNADTVIAGGLFYSNLDDKVTNNTESSSGLTFAYKKTDWAVFGDYGLVDSVETGADKFDGGGYFRISGRYNVDDLRYGADMWNWNAKSSTSGVEQQSYGVQTYMLRAIRTLKNAEGSELFYGAGIVSNRVDCRTQLGASCSKSFTRMNLPVLVGVEFNAADWLILRGSVTQSVLFDNTKDQIGLAATSGISGATGATSDLSASANNTVVAGGVGLKFANVLIDGTLAGMTNQNLNSASVLSQLGVTYKF